MKIAYRIILISIITYISFAFCLLEENCIEWSEEQRICMLIIAVVSNIFFPFLYDLFCMIDEANKIYKRKKP